MIMREWKTADVISFTIGTDAYGQKRQLGSSTRRVEVVLKLRNIANVIDVRFAEADYIALTYDTEITDANQLIIDDNKYEVMYVIPSGRLHQLYLKKV